MPLNLKPGKIYSKRIYPHCLHIDWKSGTVITCNYNCMHLTFPKISKRFSSSLTRDVAIYLE